MAINRRFFGSIGKKILLWFLIISIIPAGGMTFISYWHSKKLLKEQLTELLERTVDMVSKEVYCLLEAKKSRIVNFSSDGFIREAVTAINSGVAESKRVVKELNYHLLVNKLPLDSDIMEIFITDLDGKVIGSTNEIRLETDVSDANYFIEGRRRELYFSDVHCFNNEYEPIVTASKVLTNVRTNDPVGMLVIIIKGDVLCNITRSWDNTKDNSTPRFRGMGLTGDVYVVNGDYLMITESRFVENTILRQVVDTKPVKRAFTRGEEMSGVYLDYRGSEVLGTSRLIDEMGWVIVAEKELAEAIEPINGLRNIGIGLSSVGAVVVIIVAFSIARSLTNPIHKLVTAMEKVAEGNLDYHILTTAKDEIGYLSNSFNVMTDSLKEAKTRHESDIKILKETQLTTMVRLAMLAEKRDPETGEHLDRIKEYSRLIAVGLRRTEKYKKFVNDKFIEMLVQSSPLHDIGKVAIPDSILLKKGSLTKDEFEIMKQHTIKGAEILKGPEFLKMGYEIALYHHEKWDGSGYPYGLSDGAIPLSARIVALADMYDALTTKRV
ncbi:MAG: HD domain-containing protein, partial [Planctomycetes bacterium]|nr:HD domain-containing protein [Planctomycetota bacterium]